MQCFCSLWNWRPSMHFCEFGAKIVLPKRILKMLPEHQDQNVRASSKRLTFELFRWVCKDDVKSILFEKMRDTMKKEWEAEVVNVTGTAKPSRRIRSEKDKEPEQETISEVVGAGPAEKPSPSRAEIEFLKTIHCPNKIEKYAAELKRSTNLLRSGSHTYEYQSLKEQITSCAKYNRLCTA